MNPSIKSKIPLIFLTLISIWWGFYYSSANMFNDFGNANYEWLFLLDALVALPILCFICESDKQKALLKAAILCCSAVFIGSFVIPEQSKFIWHYLESGRYVVLAIIIVMEISAIATVYIAIKTTLNANQDPDKAIENPIQKTFGRSFFSSVLTFEARVWTFALFSSRISSDSYIGDCHFFCDKKDGTQSNLLGFILLILIEIPLVHLLLHFLWTPIAANVISILTVFGLVFFFAEYKAVAKRPISLKDGNLIIRYGLYQPYAISLENIFKLGENETFIKRDKNIKRFNYSGVPNVKLELSEQIDGIRTVYIGVNSPTDFIKVVENAKNAL